MKPDHATPTTLPNLVDIDTLAAHLGVSVRRYQHVVDGQQDAIAPLPRRCRASVLQ
jgi:hypothetical protein